MTLVAVVEDHRHAGAARSRRRSAGRGRTSSPRSVGHEALPHEGARRLLAEEIQDGRAEVEERDEPFDDARLETPGGVDEERHVNELVVDVDAVLLGPVLAERLAVIVR